MESYLISSLPGVRFFSSASTRVLVVAVLDDVHTRVRRRRCFSVPETESRCVIENNFVHIYHWCSRRSAPPVTYVAKRCQC